MKNEALINWLCLTGVAAFILYIIATLVAPLYYPGYDWMSQAVSDLSALTSPSRVPWLIMWSLGSAFAVLSVVLVSIVFQRKGTKALRAGIYTFAIMTWFSLGYTMFPLSEGGNAGTALDIAHIWVVTPLVTISTIISLVLIIIGGRNASYRMLSIFAACTLTLVMVGATGISVAGEAYFGLFERFTVYSIMAFTAVLGVFGFKQP